jgi:hypothetical protein
MDLGRGSWLSSRTDLFGWSCDRPSLPFSFNTAGAKNPLQCVAPVPFRRLVIPTPGSIGRSAGANHQRFSCHRRPIGPAIFPSFLVYVHAVTEQHQSKAGNHRPMDASTNRFRSARWHHRRGATRRQRSFFLETRRLCCRRLLVIVLLGVPQEARVGSQHVAARP